MTAQLTDSEHDELAPLALRPPILIGSTTPVEGYDGGIPVRAVEGGLRFVINAWYEMSVNDHVKVFWHDPVTEVWSKIIEAGEEGMPVEGTIAAKHIVRGDAQPVFYRVKHVNQAPEDSDRQLMLVKLDRPGGFDDDQGTPGHSNLKYLIPQAIIDHGVGPVEAEAGVPVTIQPYLFMRKNDRVRLAWGSAEKKVTVTEDQARDPKRYPLIITVDKAMIEFAGDSAGVAVSYQVVDEVGNYPDERSPWSAITYILVDQGGNRLDAPLVLEADPATHVIDLETLGDTDVTVLVNTSGGQFKVNDKIVMTWVGTPAEGSPVVEGPIELPVVRVGIAVLFSIPNAKVRAIAKGQASVSYVLKSAGVADRPSKSASVSVAGETFVEVEPTLTSVKGDPSGVEIPHNTTTTETTVILSGIASKDQEVEVFDGTDSKGRSRADLNSGGWTLKVPALKAVAHSFIAKALYGKGAVSAVRSFRVVAPLAIDPTLMNLNGFSVKVPGWAKTGQDSVGNTATRVATGGIPPYSYISSNPNAASVEQTTGKVTGHTNGTATITVVDAKGNFATYLVAITNVWRLQINEELMDGFQAISWMNSLGGSNIYHSEFPADVNRVYIPPARTKFYWACTQFWLVDHHTFLHRGSVIHFTGALNQHMGAWCIVPL